MHLYLFVYWLEWTTLIGPSLKKLWNFGSALFIGTHVVIFLHECFLNMVYMVGKCK
jgi:hypothetical protein